MPKLVRKRPAYNHHKASNRARVCIDGQYRYLPGAYDSAESWAAYWALINEVERRATPVAGPPAPKPHEQAVVAPRLLTIAELLELYDQHARIYYRRDGKVTAEPANLRCNLRPLLEVYGLTIASAFTPGDLRRVRDEMIRRGWSRRHINHAIGRVKRFFNWCVEYEHIPEHVAGALARVKGLEEYRSLAREKPPVESVPDSVVDATLPHFCRSQMAANMVRLQRLTACRPGELVAMTVEEIDRRDPECWWYRPRFHKTMHQGKDREIPIGRKAQAILLPYLVAAGTGRVFRYAHRDGYRLAVWRACDRAFPHPILSAIPKKELTAEQRTELKAWRKAHRWCPLQLRHTAAEEIRDVHGLDYAQAVLGHSHASTTEIYAKVRREKAREVVKATG